MNHLENFGKFQISISQFSIVMEFADGGDVY